MDGPHATASPAADTLRPGQVIGGAVIEALIAGGGMGLVYRARKTLLDRTVAVKILKPERASVPSFLARFLREGKIAASFDHPNIVKVFDVGEDDGRYFIVMELIEGTNLLDLVTEKGALPAGEVLRIGRQVADALAYAHDRGVIHRDIKPGNILLMADGTVKVADLGLARPIREDTEVTNPGQIIGTPVYMAPEQCRGSQIDARTDIYSLGATLYMLLAGKAPYRADTAAALVHCVVHEPPRPLKSIAAETPDKVVALVQRLMAKHPVARFQTAKEVMEAMDGIALGRFRVASEARGDSAPRRETAFPRTRTQAPSGGAVVLLIAAALAAAYMLFAGASPPAREVSAAQPAGSPAKDAPAPAKPVVIHPLIPTPESTTSEETSTAGTSLPANLRIFRDAIASSDMDRLLGCFEPEARSNSRLRSTLENLIQGCRSRELEPGSPIVQREDETGAATVIFFHSRKDARTLGIPVDWYRRNGQWFAKPRVYEFPSEL